MFGCHLGKLFQLTVSGGSYQDALTATVQGIPPGIALTEQEIAVKPTPTIDKKQHTIDKYTLKTTELSAITRRDPTITNRIWPVAENYSALVILDQLIAHFGYQNLMGIVDGYSKK